MKRQGVNQTASVGTHMFRAADHLWFLDDLQANKDAWLSGVPTVMSREETCSSRSAEASTDMHKRWGAHDAGHGACPASYLEGRSSHSRWAVTSSRVARRPEMTFCRRLASALQPCTPKVNSSRRTTGLDVVPLCCCRMFGQLPAIRQGMSFTL